MAGADPRATDRAATDRAITGGGMVSQAASDLAGLPETTILYYEGEFGEPREVRVRDLLRHNEGLLPIDAFVEETGLPARDRIVTDLPAGGTRYLLKYDAAASLWRLLRIDPLEPAGPPPAPRTVARSRSEVLKDELAAMPPAMKAETLAGVFGSQLGFLLEMHEALVSGVELAAEQVQEKRLEWQESSPPLDIQEQGLSLLLDLALDFAIGKAGGYILRYGRSAVPGLARAGSAFLTMFGDPALSRRDEGRWRRYQRTLDEARIGDHVSLRALSRSATERGQRRGAVMERFRRGKERELTAAWLGYLDSKRYVGPVKRAGKALAGLDTSAAPKAPAAPDAPGVMLRRIARGYLGRTRRQVEQWRAGFGWALQAALDEIGRDPPGSGKELLEQATAVVSEIADAIDDITEDFEPFAKAAGHPADAGVILRASMLRFEEAIWALHYAHRIEVHGYVFRPIPLDPHALEIEGAEKRMFAYWKARFTDDEGNPLPSNYAVMTRFKAIRKRLDESASRFGMDPGDVLQATADPASGEPDADAPDAPAPEPTAPPDQPP